MYLKYTRWAMILKIANSRFSYPRQQLLWNRNCRKPETTFQARRRSYSFKICLTLPARPICSSCITLLLLAKLLWYAIMLVVHGGWEWTSQAVQHRGGICNVAFEGFCSVKKMCTKYRITWFLKRPSIYPLFSGGGNVSSYLATKECNKKRADVTFWCILELSQTNGYLLTTYINPSIK